MVSKKNYVKETSGVSCIKEMLPPLSNQAGDNQPKTAKKEEKKGGGASDKMNRKTLGINEILNAKSSLLKRKSDEVTKEQRRGAVPGC